MREVLECLAYLATMLGVILGHWREYKRDRRMEAEEEMGPDGNQAP